MAPDGARFSMTSASRSRRCTPSIRAACTCSATQRRRAWPAHRMLSPSYFRPRQACRCFPGTIRAVRGQGTEKDSPRDLVGTNDKFLPHPRRTRNARPVDRPQLSRRTHGDHMATLKTITPLGEINKAAWVFCRRTSCPATEHIESTRLGSEPIGRGISSLRAADLHGTHPRTYPHRMGRTSMRANRTGRVVLLTAFWPQASARHADQEVVRPTSRTAVSQSLRDAGLERTALGREWLKADTMRC